MSNLKNQILQLLDKNKTYNEIARQLGCGKGTVAYHAKRQNIESVNKNLNKIDNLDWNSIQEYFDAGYTAKQCREIFNFSKNVWDRAVDRGHINYVKNSQQKIPHEEIFCENSQHQTIVVRRRTLRENLIPYECNICGTNTWNGKKLTLDLDHINGINNDHRLENLRFLCPNCHSQTETYAGKNFSDHQKFTEEQIVEIREALEAGESVSSLCRKYNVKYNTISSIRDNKTYKYI